MIHPSPTTQLDPTVSRAKLLQVSEAQDSRPATVTLSFFNNSYQSEFVINEPTENFTTLIGEMVLGRIFAEARKVTSPQAGGRKLDPCLGPPRRVMGTVVGVDPVNEILVVNAGTPVALRLTAPNQSVSDFANAEFVVCDILPGACFELLKTD